MRSQRLLSCLLLLQRHGRRSARELAASLGVSTRTIYRDVDELSLAGIPIHMERGAGGGVVLADDYQRAFARFSADELRGLFAMPAEPLADLGLPDPRRGLETLLGALPAAQRSAVRDGRDRLVVDHNRWYRPPSPPALLADLHRAVAADRSVVLRYRDRDGEPTERPADPLGLVAKAGVWYLVARVASGEYRTFRVDRIAGFDRTERAFRRPPDFDLDAYWRTSTASVERRSAPAFEATLRVRSRALDRLTPYWQTDVLDADERRPLVRARFPNRDLAVLALLILGDDVELIEPRDLGAEIAERAASALARYGTPRLARSVENR